MKYFLKCLYNYFNNKGRARRKEFWYIVLYSSIIIVLWTLIWIGAYYSIDRDRIDLFLKMNNGGGYIIVLLGYSFPFLFLSGPFISVAARRFRDTGITLKDYEDQSLGLTVFWTVILFLLYIFCMAWISDVTSSICCASIIIPVIICTIVNSRCFFIKGTEGDNPFGSDPRIDDPIDEKRNLNERERLQ